MSKQTIDAVVLRLVLLGAFLRQVLFTPVEEGDQPSVCRAALREPPLSERYRLRGFSLLRQG